MTAACTVKRLASDPDHHRQTDRHIFNQLLTHSLTLTHDCSESVASQQSSRNEHSSSSSSANRTWSSTTRCCIGRRWYSSPNVSAVWRRVHQPSVCRNQFTVERGFECQLCNTSQSTFYSLLLLPKLAQCQQPATHSATGKHWLAARDSIIQSSGITQTSGDPCQRSLSYVGALCLKIVTFFASGLFSLIYWITCKLRFLAIAELSALNTCQLKVILIS